MYFDVPYQKSVKSAGWYASWTCTPAAFFLIQLSVM